MLNLKCTYVKILYVVALIILTTPHTVAAQAFRYSVNTGTQGLDAAALKPSINQDHRYVVFHSQATNISSAADPLALNDIFLSCQDIELITGNTPSGTQRTTHVSFGLNGFADGNSTNAKISPDGRYIVFQSDATNLVSGDTNQVSDIFLYERPSNCNGNCSCTSESGIFTRISRPLDNNADFSGETNGASYNPQISKDGCYIAFESDASNFDAKGPTGNSLSDTNGKRDIFLVANPLNNSACTLRGCASGDCSLSRSLQVVSALPVYSDDGNDIDSEILGNGDSVNPSISRDGYVAFTSNATNLSTQNTAGFNQVYVEGQCRFSNASFAGKKLLLASVASDGTPGNGNSDSAALQQIASPVIVAFASDATNLVADDTNGKRDIFTRTYQSSGVCLNPGETARQSVATDGTQANGDSFRPTLARQAVFFSSDATNLANRVDCNSARDVFVHVFAGGNDCSSGEARPVPRTELAGASQAGYQPNGASDYPIIAPDFDQSLCPTPGACGGSFVVFESAATNIVPKNPNAQDNDINALNDAYGSLGIRNPCLLSDSLELKEPPQLCPLSRSAEVYLQEFSGADTVFGTQLPTRTRTTTANKVKRSGTCGKNPEVCYELTLTPLKKNLRPNPAQDVRRVLSKRNLLTTSRLPSGNYSATFKVRGNIGNSKKSPPTVFKVSK